MIRAPNTPIVPSATEPDQRGLVMVRLTRRTNLGDGEHLDATVEVSLPCDPVSYTAWLDKAQSNATKTLRAAIKSALEEQ